MTRRCPGSAPIRSSGTATARAWTSTLAAARPHINARDLTVKVTLTGSLTVIDVRRPHVPAWLRPDKPNREAARLALMAAATAAGDLCVLGGVRARPQCRRAALSAPAAGR